jgi:cell division protein FtsW
MSTRSDRAAVQSSSLVNPAMVIVVCAIGLTYLGLSILFSASAWFKKGPYFYLNKQLIGVVVACGVCFVVSRMNLDYLRRYAWWIAGGAVLLLALVLAGPWSVSVNGSRRWLGYGPARLQVRWVWCCFFSRAQNGATSFRPSR